LQAIGALMGDPPRVLVVEDNQTIRDAFALLLEESGYRVDGAASGEQALARASESRPDIILMDLGLPDLNGLEVTRRLKADPRTAGAVIIALTGRALETDRAACLAAGCAGYLAKPVDSARLLSAIPEFLRDREPGTNPA
jgi:CheY-like chemotaxis protein